MADNSFTPILKNLKNFANAVTDKFSTHAKFQPEDQLKGPVAELIESLGKVLGLDVTTVTEVQVASLSSRPDLGVMVNGLLTGHVELKAPGKGANPSRFKGHDKAQWKKFQYLPNLLYTDGNEWALYRNGKRIGRMLRLSGDVTTDGKEAVGERDARELMTLFRDFLRWEPVVPASPRALAKLIAPLCRLLRTDVLAALQESGSNIALLAADWRRFLFPDADDAQFADAYAQTLTYALLLARLSGAGADLTVQRAARTIRTGHHLLADALKILGDPGAREEIDIPVALLERVIGAVDPAALSRKSKGDPWLYFYEDFLAEYDPKLRNNRGVYYTPVEVVQAQVRLVAELLEKHFDAEFSFVDRDVLTLDPAVGTGTYILAALDHGLEQIAAVRGQGMRASAATRAAKNMYAFEILVGPYAVAHLRLTQRILAEKGGLPEDGVHVFLTDTLESPHKPPPRFPYMYKELAEEHRRAQEVKAKTPILVCIGNPPYDRQQIDPNEAGVRRKGGWVRFGDRADNPENRTPPLLEDFIKPLATLDWGVHAKNLYNDYVYFWRWALWKVFENKGGPGIVSFITASSYLRGPGFAGMREVMRRTFDELWIIDLEGDNLGARKTENVFAIRTPVAIAVGVRYGPARPETPATVHYTRISGTREEKLQTLGQVATFADLTWRPVLSGWHDLFLPTSDKPYWDWPLVTDIFPWQVNGVKAGRTWPIATHPDVLRRRWQVLMSSRDRRLLFKDSPTGRKAHQSAPELPPGNDRLPPILDLPQDTPPPPILRYAFRSFDRQWLLADGRLLDRPSPDLWRAHSDRQIYLTSLLTKVLGEGTAAVATALIPDLDHFCNRGAKDVVPLWRDRQGTEPNIVTSLLPILARTYGVAVSAEDLFTYTYALLASPEYVRQFWDELTIPGPRLPLTKDDALFQRAAGLGRRLIWLHTFGERFVPPGQRPGRVPPGEARCKVGVPPDPEKYPETFSYNPATRELHVGEGVFGPLPPEVWEFSVSGLDVLQSWLKYRMKKGAGRKSSPLDDIRPETWAFDDELLDLLWVLEATVKLYPELEQLLHEVLANELFRADELPQPKPGERKPLSSAPMFEKQ